MVVAVVVGSGDVGCLEQLSVVAHQQVGVLVVLCLLGKDVWSEEKESLVAPEGGVKHLLCVWTKRIALGVERDCVLPYGNSALMRAADKGETDVVVELVKAGANLDLQNENGKSALMRAASNGRTDVVVELVKAGANLDLQNKKGDSAVITATVEHEADSLRELVRAGSDLNLQNQEGLTALMIAGRSGGTGITNILLEGEHINLDIQENNTGWSALFFAAEEGDTATTQALIKAGANPHLRDRNGLTALEVASASDQDTSRRRRYGRDFAAVCQLLTEASTTPHSHPWADSETGEQESPDHDQDTTATQPHVLDTSQITSHQRRRRRNVSEAVRNLVNRSRKVAVEIFSGLDRRLKSADKKDQSEVGGDGVPVKKTRGKRQSNNQTSSTTLTTTAQ